MRVAVIWGDTRTVLLAEIFSFLYCSVWIEQSMINMHSDQSINIYFLKANEQLYTFCSFAIICI
jgi:hypothetical protein